MPTLFRLIILVAAFCLSTSIAYAETFKAMVIGVADGDTITVLYDNHPLKIRLASIDCPEKKQAFGTQAKRFTSDLVFNKEVTVDPQTKDRYGRTIANVYLADGRLLNYELVKAGFAWLYTAYSHDQTLKAAEETARGRKLGLWKDPNPTPPWLFRRMAKSHPKSLTPTAAF